jgi:hypothetical protein
MSVSFSRTVHRIFFLIGTSLFLIPLCAYAQSSPLADPFGSGLRDAENSVFIQISPTSPKPGESVRLTAESPLLDLTKSNILWQVNGKTVIQGIGATEASFVTDPKGGASIVDIQVRDESGGIVTKSITILPLEIDLLYDSPTYVPPFYRGRALPSTGSALRMQAITRFPQGGGAYMQDSAITYTWSRNGRTMGSVSGRGKSSAVIDAPALFSTDTISVTASANDGALSATESVVLSSRDPLLALYQVHPLYGMLYHQEVLSQKIVSENEMTFAAVPYFANAVTPEDSVLRYRWSVNGTPVAATSTTKSMLTIRAGSSGGVANLAIDLSHAVNFFTASSKKWSINFGEPGGVGAQGADVSDLFRGTE